MFTRIVLTVMAALCVSSRAAQAQRCSDAPTTATPTASPSTWNVATVTDANYVAGRLTTTVTVTFPGESKLKNNTTYLVCARVHTANLTESAAYTKPTTGLLVGGVPMQHNTWVQVGTFLSGEDSKKADSVVALFLEWLLSYALDTPGSYGTVIEIKGVG
jgi:hypothetical protein